MEFRGNAAYRPLVYAASGHARDGLARHSGTARPTLEWAAPFHAAADDFSQRPDGSTPVTTFAISAAEKRAKLAQEVRAKTGIDEAMIERLVRGFYARVREDALIGPVFAARIADWEPHLQRMFAFWSSVALMTERYAGRPMQKHLPLPIDGRHFDRWLQLFEATARDLCPVEAADHFIGYARRIAESLELGIAGSQGVLLLKGERLQRPELDALESIVP